MSVTLVYGMQRCGGSFVTWCLAGDREQVVIPDLHRLRGLSRACLPEDAIIKAAVSTRISLEGLLDVLEPDRVIMVLRDEQAIRRSLLQCYRIARIPEAYLRHGVKDIGRKLEIMRRAVGRKDLWDEVVYYEDFADGQQQPERGIEEVVRYNWATCRWCRDNGRPQKWGLGGIRPAGMSLSQQRRLGKLVKYGPQHPADVSGLPTR